MQKLSCRVARCYISVLVALIFLPSLGESLDSGQADVPPEVSRVPVAVLAAENARLHQKIEQLEVARALSPTLSLPLSPVVVNELLL